MWHPVNQVSWAGVLGFVMLASAACSSGADQSGGGGQGDPAPPGGAGAPDGGGSTLDDIRHEGAPVCRGGHWCWDYPLPQGASLVAVHGTADDDVWMVGEHGTILWWGGKGLAPVESGTTKHISTGVYAIARDDVWLVGAGGALLHWDGKKLVRMPDAEGLDLSSISGTGRDDVWVAANDIKESSKSYLLHWDGRSWTKELTGHPSLDVVFSFTKDEIWAGGSKNETPSILHRVGGRLQDVPLPATEYLRALDPRVLARSRRALDAHLGHLGLDTEPLDGGGVGGRFRFS